MKKTAWVRLTAINILLLTLILLPFLPGPSNKAVIVLSAFAQSAGFFGLPLVLIGLAWLGVEIRKKDSSYDKNGYSRLPYYFAIATTTIVTLISLLLWVGVCANIGQLNTGLMIGFAGLVLYVLILVRAIKAIKKLKGNRSIRFNPLPLYLITIPVVAFCTRTYLMEPMSNYSRNVAIEKAAVLINSIEKYKSSNGHYPESLAKLDGTSLTEMKSAPVMGITDFRYNQIGDRYSISFSQWLELGSLEEIVLYDKDDLRNNLSGEFAKYDYSFDLCRIKGAPERHDTKYNNWHYYQVD